MTNSPYLGSAIDKVLASLIYNNHYQSESYWELSNIATQRTEEEGREVTLSDLISEDIADMLDNGNIDLLLGSHIDLLDDDEGEQLTNHIRHNNAIADDIAGRL